MEWHEILIGILGAVGGLAGVGAFVKSFFFVKQDGEAKTIDNTDVQHLSIENETQKTLQQ